MQVSSNINQLWPRNINLKISVLYTTAFISCSVSEVGGSVSYISHSPPQTNKPARAYSFGDDSKRARPMPKHISSPCCIKRVNISLAKASHKVKPEFKWCRLHYIFCRKDCYLYMTKYGGGMKYWDH